jgi:hypothetical protein
MENLTITNGEIVRIQSLGLIYNLEPQKYDTLVLIRKTHDPTTVLLPLLMTIITMNDSWIFEQQFFSPQM